MVLSLISCNIIKKENSSGTKGADDNLEAESIKEVVFSNYYRGWESENTIVRGYNEIINDYNDTQNERNADTLYAFVIIFNTYEGQQGLAQTNPAICPEENEKESPQEYSIQRFQYETDIAKKILKDNGFYLLADYPYSSHSPYIEDTNGELIPNDVDFNHGLCAFAGTLKDIERVFGEKEPINGWYCRVVSAVRPDFEVYLQKAGWKNEEFSVWYSKNREKVNAVMGNENQVIMSVKIQ